VIAVADSESDSQDVVAVEKKWMGTIIDISS
jgi:hypothetical protein